MPSPPNTSDGYNNNASVLVLPDIVSTGGVIVNAVSFDDLYNNLRVFKRDVKGTTASSSNTQNVSFMSADNTSSTNDDPVGFDKTKVECFNCHKIRHFTRDCKAKGNQDSRRRDAGYNGYKTRENGRRPTSQDDSKALVSINGEDIDWSGHVEEDAQNYAMMAYSSSNLGSDNESVFMNKASDLEDIPVNDRYADGMHAVPPPMTGNYMPFGPDVEIDYSKFTYGPKQTSADESDSKPNEYASCESDSSVETSTSMPELVENASKVLCEPKVWTDAPIIEEYESDSDNDSVSNVQVDKEKPNFAFTNSVKHVKTFRKNIKAGTTNRSPKIEKQDRNGHTRKGLGYAFTRKACFVCGSFIHLIRDCDFHEKRMAKQAELTKSKNKVTGHRENRLVWHNVQRVNHQNKFDSSVLLIKTGKFPVNAARQNYSSQAASTSTAKKDDPHKALKDKGIVDSGCFRHMTGNKAYLADYQEFKSGSVAFGGSNERITVENQANKSAGLKEANNSIGTQANDDQGANSKEINLNEEHFVLPIWSAYSTTVKSSGDKIEKNTDFKMYEKPVSQVQQVCLE
nr:hypothetical protein [Tanacetum cinerariifolium]